MTDSKIGSKQIIASETANAASDDQLVAQCRKVWSANESRDLEARYELGKLLNMSLGTPEKRQKHGAETAKKIAAELKMSRSELTRMRHFAHRYSDFSVFRKRKPSCTNWTQVKKALVDSTTKKSPRRVAVSKATVRQLTRRIRDLKSVLESEELLRDVASNIPFREELQSLIEVAGRYLPSEPKPS